MDLLQFKNSPIVNYESVDEILDEITSDEEKIEVLGIIIAYRKRYLTRAAHLDNGAKPSDVFSIVDDHIIDYCTIELDMLYEIKRQHEGEQVPMLKKIKWNGSPALFGHLFSEFGANDFIQVPVHNGEMNVSQYARDLWEHFEIDTTLGNLTKELGNSSLSDTKRAKFPDFKDLS